jgi:gliding motility-associated-like protein
MKKLIIALLILCCRGAEAQTCTGGLGDPIVDITFGSGTGTGAPLAQGITNLTYVGNECPSDGYYTIVNSESGCWGNTWLTVPSDHTGDPNGYFMLINASYQPSDFYVQTISGLCPGTTFQFAAWILNMASIPNEILPNITFTIESTSGTVLGTYNTGDIPDLQYLNWTQYGFYFNTPPGVNTVVLRMTNNAPGGNGNDLALDDITFRAAGPAIQETVAGYSTDSVSLCQNDPGILTFNATVENCYPTAIYQWQQSTDGGATWNSIMGAASTSLTRLQTGPGSYDYRLTVAQAGNIGVSSCEVAAQPISVNVIAIPAVAVTIAASKDSSCVGAPVTFTATPDSGGANPIYQWMLNTVNVGSGGPSYVSSTLNSSDVVTCSMISDAACNLLPIVYSNPLSITVSPVPVTSVDITASATNICKDSVVTFTAIPFNGGGDPSYQWTVNGAATGPDSPVFAYSGLNNGDVVSCAMTGSIVCSPTVTATQPVTMTIYPLPVIELTPDTVIAGGQSLRLSPLVGLPTYPGFTDSIATFQWSPATWLDDPGSPDPVATPVGTITYQLKVATMYGCKASAKEIVGVFYSLQMPGAFTPNGDGHNDLFRLPPQTPISVMRLAVYNRQGAMLFATTNVAAGWDGTYSGHPQPSGVYVWVMEYQNPLSGRMEAAKGTVVLVR